MSLHASYDCLSAATECPKPNNPENGRVFVENAFFGSVANFVCDAGFFLDGSSNITCKDDRSWTSHQPRCERKYGPLVWSIGALEGISGWYGQPSEVYSRWRESGTFLKPKSGHFTDLRGARGTWWYGQERVRCPHGLCVVSEFHSSCYQHRANSTLRRVAR